MATGLKKRNGVISCSGITNKVKWFEETDSLENRRSGRPSLAEIRLTAVEIAVNDLAVESSTGSSSVRRAENNDEFRHFSSREYIVVPGGEHYRVLKKKFQF